MSDTDNISQSDEFNLENLLEQKEKLEGLIRDKYTRLVTVMFTDMKGSTALAEREGDLAVRTLIKDHNNIVLPLIRDNGGVLVKTMGDGTLSYFSEPQGALRAAAELQRKFETYNAGRPGKTPIMIRVGMHTGQAIIEETDIFGDVVNTASRFESGGVPGEIHISEQTYELLSDKDEIPCRFIKEAVLKGKSEPFKVFKVYWKAGELEKDLEKEALAASAPPKPAAHSSATINAVAPAAVADDEATIRPGASPSSGRMHFSRQAQSLHDSGELIQLLLFCEENSAFAQSQEMLIKLTGEIERGARDIRFFGEDALWFYKYSMTTGRLQDADFPITNKAVSRAPITLSVRGGEGFVRGADGMSPMDVEAGGSPKSLQPNAERSLGKGAGRLVLSACFPVEYRIFRERFLVFKMMALKDCVKRQMNMELSDIWRNFEQESRRLIILGK